MAIPWKTFGHKIFSSLFFCLRAASLALAVIQLIMSSKAKTKINKHELYLPYFLTTEKKLTEENEVFLKEKKRR